MLGTARRTGIAEIIETVRDKVPAEVFTTPYEKIPLAAVRRRPAVICARATRLLKEAGFEIRDGKLIDSTGKPVSVEFLCQDPAEGASRAVLQAEPGAARRYHEPSARSTTCNTRTACAVSTSTSPRAYGCNRCRRATSSAIISRRSRRIGRARGNLPGIKNPAVDALIDRIIFAKDRAELAAS